MRRQTLNTCIASSTYEHEYIWYPNLGTAVTKKDASGFNQLARSEVVRNVKSEGYRKPSSYMSQTTANIPEYGINGSAKSNVILGTCDMHETRDDYYGIIRRVYGSVIGQVEPNGMPQGNDYNSIQKLRTKILNNIKDEVFDVAMVLAELQSTVNTCTTAMSRIGWSMNALLRKDKRVFEYLWTGKMPTGANGRTISGRYADRFNRQVSSMYLEWKYGVMPSVLDFQGACKGLDINEKGGLFDNPPLAVARAVQKEDVSGKAEIRNCVEASGTRVMGEVTWKGRTELKARCDYRVTGDGLRGLSRYGIGLGTLPTVMWDKTPFSFVFDMVVPVASMLKAWTALAGCEVLGYCETLHQKWEFDDAIGYGERNGAMYKFKGATGFYNQRVAYPSVPMPLPFVQNPIKSGNAATVLALFTQLRRKAY